MVSDIPTGDGKVANFFLQSIDDEKVSFQLKNRLSAEKPASLSASILPIRNRPLV